MTRPAGAAGTQRGAAASGHGGAGWGTFDVNLQTKTVVWSAAHLRMLGYDATTDRETTIDLWRSCVHPEDLPECWQRGKSPCDNDHPTLSNTGSPASAHTGEIAWLAVFSATATTNRETASVSSAWRLTSPAAGSGTRSAGPRSAGDRREPRATADRTGAARQCRTGIDRAGPHVCNPSPSDCRKPPRKSGSCVRLVA